MTSLCHAHPCIPMPPPMVSTVWPRAPPRAHAYSMELSAPQGLHFSPQNTPTCPGHNHGLSGLTHAIPRASPLRMAFPMPWPGPTQGTTRRSSRAHPVLFRALPRPNQGQPTAHPGPPPGHHQAHQNVVPETIFRSQKQHGIPLVSNSLKLCRVYP